MKKKLVISAGVVLLLALAIPVSNFFVGAPVGTPLTVKGPGDPGFAKVAAVFEVKCLNCHSSETRLPFYASLPMIGGLIEEDVEEGRRALDMMATLLPENGAPVSEVVIAKLEQTILKDTMPPGRYVALHWDGGLDDEDRAHVLEWVRDVRMRFYAPVGIPDAVRAQVIQPLPEPPRLDARKVALGKRLFHDTRLSHDDTLSCASCHALNRGGTDQSRFSTGIDGQMGGINAPTVYNAVFHVRQFWDGRAADLAEQAGGPVVNPIEMGSGWPEVIAKLSRDVTLAREMEGAFGGVTAAGVTSAIAAFEATLVTPDSAFDRYLMGDEQALSDAQKEGYKLFLDHDCATCHVGKAMGGQSFELMGRKADYFGDRGSITEADAGLANFTKKDDDRHKFKVPSLRNIALTHPYMHDGTAVDLAQAVRIMSKYQVRPELSKSEIGLVARFLESLTGEYQGKVLK